jgi:hypothetical protein
VYVLTRHEILPSFVVLKRKMRRRLISNMSKVAPWPPPQRHSRLFATIRQRCNLFCECMTPRRPEMLTVAYILLLAVMGMRGYRTFDISPN